MVTIAAVAAITVADGVFVVVCICIRDLEKKCRKDEYLVQSVLFCYRFWLAL